LLHAAWPLRIGLAVAVAVLVGFVLWRNHGEMGAKTKRLAQQTPPEPPASQN
jgi:hypothetical protein